MIGMESAITLLSISAPVTVAIMKLVPRRVSSPTVAADIAAINATLIHMKGELIEIKRDIRDLRNRV